MGIKNFEVRNFTVFKEAKFEFEKGINVLIGENGTGKTHLLKMLYAQHNNENIGQGDIFYNRGYAPTLEKEFQDNGHRIIVGEKTSFNCVFIPAKDMLTHSKGLLAMSKKYSEFPFDRTLLDIIDKAQRWKVAETPKIAIKIFPILEKMMSGTVVIENEEFYIRKDNGIMVNFAVEAEGLKKIGLLWQLLMNESITEGTVLFWDEPEANINPKFVPDLVEILFELSRNGVQTFISTHDYIMSKYIDVKRKDGDSVVFHSLYKTDDGVENESSPSFRDLKNNTIMDTFIQLYKDEVERAME